MRMRGSGGDDKKSLRNTMQLVKQREAVEPPTGDPARTTQDVHPDEQAIWNLVERCNAAWIEGRPRDTGEVFAADAVMVAPGLAARFEGRAAIVQSFVQYCSQAKTLSFEALVGSVDLMVDTAVATYKYHVRYEMNGERHSEEGQEILVLRRGQHDWQIVWRTQITLAG